MGGRNWSRAALAICVLAWSSAFATQAFAAATSLRITGQRHVKVGASTQVVVSGSTSAARGIAIFIDNRNCPRTFVAENARDPKGKLLNRRIHTGSFRFSVTFRHSVAGRHVVCAYLYKLRRGSPTVRRAQFAYVTS